MATDTRRNKPMRLASGLLCATLLTTSIVGGTLAKYVTTDGATDTARVAKFGVVATVEGNLFGPSYKKATTGDDASNTIQTWATNAESVSAADGKNTTVVAPGTKNDKGMTVSVKGTPEVSTKVILDAPEAEGDKDYANTDIFLKAGGYSIMAAVDVQKATITTDNMGDYYGYDSVGRKFAVLTSVPESGTVYKMIQFAESTGADYYPIQWKVSRNGGEAAALAENTVAGVLSSVATGLTAGTASDVGVGKWYRDFAPNKDLGATDGIGYATVTWEWPYTSDDGDVWRDVETGGNWENTTLQDWKDTLLGEMIALATDSGGSITSYKVAKGLDEVRYAQIDAEANSANKVFVAYTGDSAPAKWSDADVACLTETFGARVTVEQVD